MEDLKILENTILDLLGSHSCVTVPGLGSFIYREFPASSNHFTFELKPAGHTVFFNSAIQADDGLLADAIRNQTGGDYTQALTFIRECVKSIENRLSMSRNLSFGRLGNFFQNPEKQIFFLPSGSLNLSPASFGLPLIKLDELSKQPVAREAETRAQVIREAVRTEPVSEETYEEAEVLEFDEPARNRGLVWKVAAGFGILTLSAAGWYFGKQYFTRHTAHQTETATMDQPVATEKTAAPELNSETPSKSQTKPQDKETVKKQTEKKPADKEATAVKTQVPAEVKALIVSNEEYKTAIEQKPGRFFVVGGTYIGEEMAKSECRKWNAAGVNASVFKPKNSSLYRIILGRFNSEKAASDFIQTMPGFHGSSAGVREMSLPR